MQVFYLFILLGEEMKSTITCEGGPKGPPVNS